MSYNCCSGNFSSRSLRDHLCYSGSSCGSSFPSNLVYRTDLCSPGSCHLGSSLYSQETCCESPHPAYPLRLRRDGTTHLPFKLPPPRPPASVRALTFQLWA